MNKKESQLQPVVVTGASGRLGNAVIRELESREIPWIGVDSRAEVRFHPSGEFAMRKADLSDFGACIEVLRYARAVIHLANHPYPDFELDQTVFTGNVTINYNVFAAAELLGVPRVVWLSSEKASGMPFELGPPPYLPLSATHPSSPECAYGLSKRTSETVAGFLSRTVRTSFVGLRAALVQDRRDYAGYAKFQTEPLSRRWHFWNYIDLEDLARACRLAVEAELSGSHVLHIAAADTVVSTPTIDLVQMAFGSIPWTGDLKEPFACLADIGAAQLAIGFRPEISWRTSV